MKKAWFVLIAGLLLGTTVGALLEQHSMHQRQQDLAVMWLLQWHTDALQSAVQRQDCRAGQQAVARIGVMAEELPQVFPLANAQDATFHQHIEHLRQAATGDGAAQVCGVMTDTLKRIRAVCADCHRDYR